MNTPQAVFVYGTLKQKGRNFHVSQQAGLTRVAKGVVDGFRLFDLLDPPQRGYRYPAILSGSGQVRGEVHWYRDLEEALGLLDRLEDTPREYQRLAITVQTAEGAVPAWVYVYPSLEAVQQAQGQEVVGGWWEEPAL